ncbi:PREDICTED: voltage-gated hydrogen channel 1 [Populus euphratica]|uniref:Voltage-gated hydrogen channel 1 n=1 Tax=Populus euphratica TaxID=75702 RepID=A0AAJ6SWQ1_POPEU|nr:PREDICTED: voltage-gated hydrogen channel 1 [Populus euphratica]
MNNPPRITGSSGILQSQPPSDSISVEKVEHLVQNLIKSQYRRRKWMHLCNPKLVLDLNREPWRNHLIKSLESTPVHVFTISLLLLDVILTILELSSSFLSCTPEEDHYNKKKVWYHLAGICILSLLSAKSVALVVGSGSSFFKRPGYVVDGAVVIGALFLETFLGTKGGGLLVIVSLWRVVRLVESAFELSDEAIEAQIEGIVSQFEALRNENSRLLQTIAEKDSMIEKLQEIIEKLEKEMNQYRSTRLCFDH